jgi:hypothetical protein
MYEPDIKIFQAEGGKTEIQVVVKSETVWLSQKQMADLFEKDSDTIGLHLRNIFKSGELIEKVTTEKSSVVQKEGKRNVTRTLKLYNLDAIISTGYRVNSKRGIQFRIWANQIIKDYLIKGYALNERRLNSENDQLKSLKESVLILTKIVNQKKLTADESEGLLKIITDYAYALDILDQYDYQNLKISYTSDTELYRITYKEAVNHITRLREIYGNGEHRPPHIHASYNEFEVLIVIETMDIYAGELPNKQLKSVYNWLSVNSDWAMKVFYELNPNLK